jgi:integrase
VGIPLGEAEGMFKLIKLGKGCIYHITGTLRGHRCRESTHTNSLPYAKEKLAQRTREILDLTTYGQKVTAVFADAVNLYLANKGETVGAYDLKAISKLNERFGGRRLSSLTQEDVNAFCTESYPRSGPHGLDRQVYTPLIAIYRMAAENNPPHCELPRFKRPKKPDPVLVRYATDDDIAKLLPHGSERLQAAILFITFTAARGSEVCRLRERDVNWDRQTAVLVRTKTKPRVVPLAPSVYEAMLKLRECKGPLFGFTLCSSLNQALERACRRAHVERFTSHEIGRHAFAARLLAQGHRLKEVQEAGGWATYRMVAEVYGHLERSAVDAVVRSADTNLTGLRGLSEKVVRIQRPKKTTRSMST